MQKQLAFQPTWPAVLKSLMLWAGLLLALTLLIWAGLLAYQTAHPGAGWNQPPLDGVSSLLVRGGEDQVIRLAGTNLACAPSGEGFHCEATLDGLPLIAEIAPGEHQAVCAATYAGEAVACRASWNNTRPFDYYAVIDDDLGLPPERFDALAEQTRDSGWTEASWMRLSLVAALLAAGGVAVVMGLRKGVADVISDESRLLRTVYLAGLAVMTFVFVRAVAAGVLLTFQLID
jgi:hypothetical protein